MHGVFESIATYHKPLVEQSYLLLLSSSLLCLPLLLLYFRLVLRPCVLLLLLMTWIDRLINGRIPKIKGFHRSAAPKAGLVLNLRPRMTPHR